MTNSTQYDIMTNDLHIITEWLLQHKILYIIYICNINII